MLRAFVAQACQPIKVSAALPPQLLATHGQQRHLALPCVAMPRAVQDCGERALEDPSRQRGQHARSDGNADLTARRAGQELAKGD
jgi:hypothetical protein